MTEADAVSLAVLAGLLLTMPWFGWVARGRATDPEVARRPRTALLGFWVRDWLMWLIGPVERALLRSGLAPDVLNLVGVTLGLAAGLAYGLGALPLGGWLVLAGGLADVLDGRIARARGLTSPYGSFLDSTLDRFAEAFVFLGLALHYAPRPAFALATAIALSGSLLVSYARARGEALGVSCRGGLMQRAERLVLLAAASLLGPMLDPLLGGQPGTLLGLALALIGVGALGTAVYRTFAIARALRRGDPSGR